MWGAGWNAAVLAPLMTVPESRATMSGPASVRGLDLLDRVTGLLAGAGSPDAASRAVRLWAALHGLASLRLHKPGGPWTATAPADAAAIVSTFLP